MLVLGIDTSGQVGSLGLVGEEGVLGEVNIRLKRRHSERLLPNIDFLLQECGTSIHELEGISITLGPGSYTGLRIGLSTVKAFVQVLEIPFIGISTLDLLAYNLVGQDKWLVPVTDARRKRVYTSLYEGWHKDISSSKRWEDRALALEDLIVKLKKVDSNGKFFLVGSGIKPYRKLFEEAELNFVFAPPELNLIRGSSVAELGRYYLLQGRRDDYRQILPRYLKKPQAEINWQKKHGTGE